jgi:hypothetical protein
MNAVEFETELMDPATYWKIHYQGWHVSGDMCRDMYLPAHSEFYRELEEAAAYMLNVFGVYPN